MEYFKLNYDKLRHLPQRKYHFGIILIVIVIIISLILSSKYTISKKISIYGQVKGGLIELKIDNALSELIINNSKLTFNGRKMNYKISQFSDYEIIDNNIYQKVMIIIDGKVYQNEIGLITINYDKQTIIKYILELFK